MNLLGLEVADGGACGRSQVGFGISIFFLFFLSPMRIRLAPSGEGSIRLGERKVGLSFW